MYKYFQVVIVSLLLVSCKSSGEFTGFSYDPPDVTNTTDKEILIQPKRAIGVDSPKVWVSNEFEGARMNDFYAVNDTVYEVFIEPENFPINNSPWFAFKAWSDTIRLANIKLNYLDATHRYIPKVQSWVQSESSWKEQMELPVSYDSAAGTATFEMLLTPDPVIISGQPLHTSSGLKPSLEERGVIGKEYVNMSEAGKSKQGRAIWELEITEVETGTKAPVLAIVGRQHPPEVTGYIASLIFLEELAADNELARRFRQTFVVKAYPMINPDGVDMGHWRHNAGGVDLNRDWENFNQPETQLIRDVLSPMKKDDSRVMFYALDFHSTNENIFYPIDEEVKTVPDNITQRWAEMVIQQNTGVTFNVEEFDTSSPIAKNWFYRTFGIDAVTYEVDDQIGESELDSVSRSAARSLMELLLEEWEKTGLEN